MDDGVNLDAVVEAGVVRIRFGEGEWLGPGNLLGPESVRTEVVRRSIGDADGLVVTLATDVGVTLERRAGGQAAIHAGVHFDPGSRVGAAPEGLRAFGLQHTEFGLPTQSGEALDRWFLLPQRPSVVWPLWLSAEDGRTLLFAPLDAFHEQVLVVPTREEPDTGIRLGWHGDLTEVPAGFTTSFAILAGDSPRGLLDAWASTIPRADRLPVDHDTLGRSVSYWTDNGAAYWYRTEPPRTVTETIRDAVISVEHAGVPIGAVQLDSWFYPHRDTRPFDTDEWLVPPSGLVEWEPREDILPDGIEPLRDAVDGRPLVTHCRHLSSNSPAVDEFDCWVDGPYAHPKGADYYEALLDRAKGWGVETYEHDWLVECFTGVHGLRAAPGRADDWQRGIDTAAAARDMTLQWCMATPADMALAASLPRITSVRTSGDHGYLVGPGFLWAWFCYTNAFARAMGLAPFKDVFLSGHEHGEVEALLSALSTGPVGVGDAIGTTVASVVLPTCNADGSIVRPDVPIAAVDACFRTHAVARPVPLVAECHTDHPAGRWTQVFCANTFRGEESIEGTIDLGPAWPSGPVVSVDLRAGHVSRPTAGWNVDLAPAAWQHHLLAPVVNDIAVFGDTGKHAPVGRSRVASIEATDAGVACTLLAPGETVQVSGWASGPVEATVDGNPAAVDRADSGWVVAVPGGSVLRVRAS